jgi:predicted RNase H-like HicB family nuclease
MELNVKKPATRYIVVVDGKPGAYGMYVPDMPGCTSMGDTIAELLANAQEAVQLWAQDALETNERLPKPRSIDAIRKDPEVARDLADGGVLAVVPLVIETGRPVKANSRSMRGCSLPSTRRRRPAGSPAPRFWQARRGRRLPPKDSFAPGAMQPCAHRTQRPTDLAVVPVLPAPIACNNCRGSRQPSNGRGRRRDERNKAFPRSTPVRMSAPRLTSPRWGRFP